MAKSKTSKVTTVSQYLQRLPADRRATISAVRDVVLRNLPKGYEEGIGLAPEVALKPTIREGARVPGCQVPGCRVSG